MKNAAIVLGRRMVSHSKLIAIVIVTILVTSGYGFLQSKLGAQLAELASLNQKVRDPDTRTRVAAFHTVWAIGYASEYSEVKSSALDLLKEPVASASDHVRMPAVYAIADIANSSTGWGTSGRR